MAPPDDILAQALSAIKTPVKRRITPTLITTRVDENYGLFDSLTTSAPSTEQTEDNSDTTLQLNQVRSILQFLSSFCLEQIFRISVVAIREL